MTKTISSQWQASLYAVSRMGVLSVIALACAVNAHAATLSINANPTSVTSGAASTLTWTSTEATSCAASGAWSGVKATSGSQNVIAPNGLSTYTLNCSGVGGSASNTVVIGAGATPPALYALNVTVSGVGTVTSNPSGIACGATCSVSYPSGAVVTLSAVAAAGYTFSSWSGACTGTGACTTTLSAARSVTATFAPSAGNAITLSLVPARTSGVAPLAVFFDASGTTDASVTTRPFHDLEYRWDFGDAAGSPVKGTTWSTGSQLTLATCSAPYNGCRNNASGAVAAHVYESAGTYTATLSVFDGTNTTAKTTTITVTDPSTLTTACVANGLTPAAGDANGCPADADLFYDASSFNTALTTAIAAGAKRVLFRKGDTFTSSATYSVNAAGPGIIGAYGTGASPNIPMAPIAQYASILKFFGSSDWRVIDLAFDGTGTADQTALNDVTTNHAEITILRVTATNLMGDVNFNNLDQLAVVDSNFSSGGSNSTGSNYGVWCGICTNVALLGNNMFLNTINSHNIRLQGANKFVVANSTQTGSDRIEPITVRGNTQYGVLSDNKFVDNIVTVKPQNSTSNEYQHDIIFERNWFVAGIYTGPSLGIEGSGITVRNNIFDMSLSPGTGITSVYNSTVGAPKPDLINIYNNTFYNSSANDGNVKAFNAIVYFAGLDTTCHSEVKNNLAYSPNTYNAAPKLIWIRAGACVITGTAGTLGNSSDSQIKASPFFASATPAIPSDYTIGAGSYAHNAGVSIPVFSDFFGTARPQGNAIDIGAVEGP